MVSATGRAAESGMGELDRIDRALATRRLDSDLFERCATDLLVETYPGLSPIPGGTDWGRDADVHGTGHEVPPRLMVTSSRSVKGVRANLMSGLRSLAEHRQSVRRVVLANPALLNEQQREKLRVAAHAQGIAVEAIYDRRFFASRLRRDGQWRSALLGLSGEPVSLSRTPSDLAESPWAALPLIGRDNEIARLLTNENDVILFGRPGTGKTRLAAALPGAVFVDAGATGSARLEDDIRWLAPPLVVIDEAAQHVDLVRRLVALRRAEGDILAYRIMCLCWPDEVDEIKTVVPSAEPFEVELLERQAVDQVIVGMGVRGQLARHEILDQAEGRPGWAVALADILINTRRWGSLADGTALLGQVERYLRRAHVGSEAVDVLTVVAAVGGVSDTELAKLAEILRMSVPSTRSLIRGAARSGLVDVTISYWAEGGRRFYGVRPPMLARALVAEHAFRTDVPVVSLPELVADWPERLREVTKAAIDSALLGAGGARLVARQLLMGYRAATVGAGGGLTDLCFRWAHVDSAAGTQVVSWARAELDRLRADTARAWRFEEVTKVAKAVAERYVSSEAITLILDVAVLDHRPPHANPSHPLRAIEELVTERHPEVAAAKGLRTAVARAADEWVGQRGNDARAWDVYGAVAGHALSLERNANYLDAADRRTVHLLRGFVTAAEIQEIYSDVWPTVRAKLTSAPPLVIRAAIDAGLNWIRNGMAHTRPGNAGRPNKTALVAKRLGTKLIRECVPLVKGHVGLASYLKAHAERCGVRLALRIPARLAPFFEQILFADDLDGSVRAVHEKIDVLAGSWSREQPAAVVHRLADLRLERGYARLNWPDCVELACEAIANRVRDKRPWVEAALSGGLFPQAEPFLAALFADQPEPEGDLVARCLDDRDARWPTLRVLLRSTGSSPSVARATASVRPSDRAVIETIALQRRLPLARQHDLLTHTDPAVRGVVAFALAQPVKDDEDWPPVEIEQPWLDAIQHVEIAAEGPTDEYRMERLYALLSRRYPDALLGFLESAVRRIADGGAAELHTSGLGAGLRLLSRPAKTGLMQRFGRTRARRFLVRSLSSDDVEWIEEALASGGITPEEVLASIDGLDDTPRPSSPQLARLLVPRGISAETIAAHAQYGVGFGEESERAESLIAEFSQYAAADDPSVAAVGAAGVAIFTRQRSSALERERIERVRGGF